MALGTTLALGAAAVGAYKGITSDSAKDRRQSKKDASDRYAQDRQDYESIRAQQGSYQGLSRQQVQRRVADTRLQAGSAVQAGQQQIGRSGLNAGDSAYTAAQRDLVQARIGAERSAEADAQRASLEQHEAAQQRLATQSAFTRAQMDSFKQAKQDDFRYWLNWMFPKKGPSAIAAGSRVAQAGSTALNTTATSGATAPAAASAASTGSAALGTAAKGLALFCWVAVALWGEESHRTIAARHWCYTNHNWFTVLYGRRGMQWAEACHTSRSVRAFCYVLWSVIALMGFLQHWSSDVRSTVNG